MWEPKKYAEKRSVSIPVSNPCTPSLPEPLQKAEQAEASIPAPQPSSLSEEEEIRNVVEGLLKAKVENEQQRRNIQKQMSRCKKVLRDCLERLETKKDK